MKIYLPKPYPDELLYSVVARYIGYTPTNHTYSLKQRLFGGYLGLNPFVPKGLSAVSAHTWPTWHMTGAVIAHRLTMYPYYESNMSEDQRQEAMEGLLNAKQSTYIRFIVSRLVPDALRFCPTCREIDLSKYGETYWRRSHQMKGVAVCADHGDQLVEAAKIQKMDRTNFVEATEATRCAAKPPIDLDQHEKKQLWAISRRCRTFLDGNFDPQWHHASPSLYRSIAMAKGLCSGPDRCQRELLTRFREIFSDNVISTFGLGEQNWVWQIFFSRTRTSFQPVAHAVIQEFLSIVPDEPAKKLNFGPGPWKCPNPFGNHKKPFPIKKVLVLRQKNKSFARTTCCCGYGFEFLMTDAADPALPVVHKVTEYGPTWAEKINRLSSTGLNARQIAATLKIGTLDVKLIQGGHSGDRSLGELRLKWKNLLRRTEHHAVMEAHQRNPSLYKKIKETDPNYLTCSFSMARQSAPDRQKKIQLHWKEKDAFLSEKLKTAAKSIMTEVPPKRVTVRAILRIVRISWWSLRPELQKCNQVLHEMVESIEAFQMRRLKYLAEKARAQGMKPTRNQLFYDGMIRMAKDKKRLEKFADSLCQ